MAEEKLKQVIVVRQDLRLSKGKLAVQTAHAAVDALQKMELENADWVKQWKEQRQEKIVLKIENEEKLLELFEEIKKKFPPALIKDAGLTQLKPGTTTCFGVGPVPEKEINVFTKHLKLV